MEETRPEANARRNICRRIKKTPKSVAELARETGLAPRFIRERLIGYCEAGRCKGRVLGQDTDGRPVIVYRVNLAFDPKAEVTVACDEREPVKLAEAA